MSHFEILEIQDLCKRNPKRSAWRIPGWVFPYWSWLFLFFSGNDTRRYLGSRIFIQPVCLYSSVLFAILFSLYVNELHDGRSSVSLE